MRQTGKMDKWLTHLAEAINGGAIVYVPAVDEKTSSKIIYKLKKYYGCDAINIPEFVQPLPKPVFNGEEIIDFEYGRKYLGGYTFKLAPKLIPS